MCNFYSVHSSNEGSQMLLHKTKTKSFCSFEERGFGLCRAQFVFFCETKSLFNFLLISRINSMKMSGEGEPSSDPWQVKKTSFQWVVKKEVIGGDATLFSSRLNFDFENKINWCLGLYGRPSDGVIWMDLLLIPTGVSAAVGHIIITKYKLGLITKDDEEANVLYQNHLFTKTSDKGWLPDVPTRAFIRLDFLLAEENNFFKNDKVTIFCDLEVYRRVEVPETILVREQRQMLESGEFSDFTLVVGGEELKVHRCVLSRSPVFRAMFQHEMKEKQSCRAKIEELDVVGVKGLVEFLYTGKIIGLEKIAKKVLPAADMYGVEGLKTLCEQELCHELHPANVTDLLELSELHSMTNLKGQALTFICENSTEVVKETSFWRLKESNQQLHRKLSREVVCALADKAQSGKPLAKRIKLN